MLLAPRQLEEAFRSQPRHAHGVQGKPHPRPLGPSEGAEQPPGRNQAGPHHLPHRDRDGPRRPETLRDVADPPPEGWIRGRAAQDLHPAGLGRKQPCAEPKDRGLPAAVGAREDDELPCAERQVHSVEDGLGPVREVDVAKL